ncbi:MAG: SLC13 family permease [Salibacteraceae bacterium]
MNATPSTSRGNPQKRWGHLAKLIAGPLAFLLVSVLPIADLETNPQLVLGLTAWMAIWWITEALPIAATALLPVVVLPVFDVVSIKSISQVYMRPIIFLFLGGFLLALAVEKWRLHERIALAILARMGTNATQLIFGFIVVTALLSMWISNTATTIMLLPIAIAVLQHCGKQANSQKQFRSFSIALLLGIAYSASIGGTATLVGTPTNLIFTAVADELLELKVGFAQWMVFALPLAVLMLLVLLLYLTRVRFQLQQLSFKGLAPILQQQKSALGPMRYEEKVVAGVFGIVALGWTLRTLLLNDWVPGLNDASLAIAGALVLFMIPSRQQPGKKLLAWNDTKALQWGILLLFGGGLALAQAFRESGLADWVGGQFMFLAGVPTLVILLLIIASVIFLTEITSNVATASVLLPVLAAMAQSLGLAPELLMVACTISASYAFMLPMATAPNAVVFSSEKIPMREMMKTGFYLNLIAIGVLLIYHYFGINLLGY